MKVKKISMFLVVLALCFFSLLGAGNLVSNAETQPSATALLDNDNRLTQSYWDMYAISSEYFTPSSDRGGDNTLQYAFDGRWDTAYQAGTDTNNGSLTIVFSQSVRLSSIIYATAQNTYLNKPNGYPATLTIYGDDEEKASIISTPSTNKMLFSFDEFTCTTLKLTFTMNGSYNWRQTASEIVLLQPEIEGINALFANYSQTQLSSQFNSESAINDLDDLLKSNINYVKGFQPMIERARKILSNEVSFDEAREFSTEPNATNQILQRGDIATYCRTTLKMRYMGTNRQITGIYGKAGEQINVYVEADANTSLPKIQFSQFNGYLMDQIGYNTWLGGEQTLGLGKNTFTYPTFDLQGANVIAGGSIYIVNPYTEEQGRVKIYIEGGEKFPVFRINEDENDYLDKLDSYTSELGNKIDMTEMQGDNIIITVEASRAQHNYRANTQVTPQDNLEKWDDYIKKLLAFDGIALSQEEQYYNEKNQYINVNIRLMQPEPGAAAYAGYEHIGIFIVEGSAAWLDNAVQMTNTGWGFAHEIGHMLDLPERTVSECSNNMFSMYAQTYITQAVREPSFYENTLSEMLNPTTSSLFNAGSRSNYLIWWYIESYFPGYWGKLDNLYRFGETIEGLTPTEKQVYLSSLATGIDLSYYFEKWGYSLTGLEGDEIFTSENASTAFKTLMSQKIEEEEIDDSIQPKIGYAQKGEMPGENEQIYHSSQKAEIVEIEAIENGYRLTLPQPTNREAHLGYEIYVKTQEGFKLIGFTYGETYDDLNAYDKEPEYAIVAVDKSFNTTAEPDENIEQGGGNHEGETNPEGNPSQTDPEQGGDEETNPNDTPSDSDNSKGSKTGLIVGIVGGVVGVIVIGLVIIFIIIKRRKSKIN